MEAIETHEHANRTINIYRDPEPSNPRTEWDNATTMVHWHRRYELGDKRIDPTNADELKAQCAEEGDPIVAILPLYLYDHSGITISTGAFSCPWDSGQVGWCYMTESQARVCEATPEQCEEIIRSEVKEYDNYLTGAVYGYEVVGLDGDVLDSCWGFSGDTGYCLTEAKSAAEASEDPGVQEQADELQARGTYAMNQEA